MVRGVHLVGSIALDTVDEVFATVGPLLRDRLRRIPDGEPGGRRAWIGWQVAVIRANPGLKPYAGRPDAQAIHKTRFCLAGGVGPDDLRFGELGYAREARTSYLDFLDARTRGLLHGDTRFQVC